MSSEDGDEFSEFDPLSYQEGERAEASTKRRLEHIIEDYNDSIDVLAEPVQNAMDAIVRANNRDLFPEIESEAEAESDSPSDNEDSVIPAKVTVEIDTDEGIIAVRDNGRGFPIGELQEFIAPEATNKRDLYDNGTVRGHKGVGLTFLAYGFNHFEVVSKVPGEEPYRLKLTGGREWVESEDVGADTRPKAAPEELEEDFERGTKVTIQTDDTTRPSNLSHVFNTAKMMKTILETQTAAGVVPPADENHPPVDITLKYTANAETEELDIQDRYRYPHEKLNEDLEDGQAPLETIEVDTESDAEVDATLRNAHHGVYSFFDSEEIAERITDSHTGEYLTEAEDIKEYIREHELEVYVLYTYSNEYRDKLKKRWNIRGNWSFHKPGIRIASDGMISLWHENTNLSYSGGRNQRLWFLYHFTTDVAPDSGRNDFPNETKDVIHGTKQFLHSDVVSRAEDYLRAAPPQSARDSELQKTPLERELEMDDISVDPIEGVGPIPHLKEPHEEQDVIGVFNQLAGMGLLNCYKPSYFTGIGAFDGFVRYDPESVPSRLHEVFPGSSSITGQQSAITLEFKRRGVDIIEHIVNNTKEWQEMDLLVCWELEDSIDNAEEDENDGNSDGDSTATENFAAQRELAGKTVTFRRPTSSEDRRYAGVTHIGTLSSAGQVPLRTIALKDLINQL
ncbi:MULTISPECIES: ATP-binding protein [Haloarcula]|uniref:ATP-binding protein n=1 Tax=Haloarcula TaxID=2237 RepID=UPI0023E76741|nr:ATP-binding protein [Halomicroarcula sp. SHR3]